MKAARQIVFDSRAERVWRTRPCASPTSPCAIHPRRSCARSTAASRARPRSSTARYAWCSCRAPRPTWSKWWSRSPAGEIVRWEVVEDVRPPLQMEEAYAAQPRARRVRRVERQRSTAVAWSTTRWSRSTRGRRGPSVSSTRSGAASPSAWPTCATRPTTTATPDPSKGCWPSSTWARGEVLEVLDYGASRSRPPRAATTPSDNGPLRTDLKPALHHPARGAELRRRGQPREVAEVVAAGGYGPAGGTGPVHGRLRGRRPGAAAGLPRVGRARWWCPTAHPSPMHSWKSAFDAGEWGLGRMANSLTLGCDCLGEIHYFDDVFADEHGKPHTKANAICMHEEDYSILWKHVDMVSGRTEVRRSRRLVVSSIATVGNYEYGFYWYFYLDGTMQLEVKLTGIMSTMAVAGEDAGEHARMVAPGLAAPLPPAPLQRAARRRDRRAGQRGVRGRRRARRPPGRQTPSAARSRRRPPCSRPSWRPGATSTRRVAGPGASPTAAGATPWGSPRPTSCCRAHADAAGRSGVEHRAARRLRGRTTCGSRRTPPTRGGRRATTRTSTRAARVCRPGRRRTGRWSTPTSWCGTPSASPTSRAPRTGRSCRSSARASADPGGVLRPQPRPRRAPAPRRGHCHA